jgi:hypothetical protein
LGGVYNPAASRDGSSYTVAYVPPIIKILKGNHGFQFARKQGYFKTKDYNVQVNCKKKHLLKILLKRTNSR